VKIITLIYATLSGQDLVQTGTCSVFLVYRKILSFLACILFSRVA